MNRQNQIDFDYADRIPASRGSDPDSSHEAAEAIDATGKRRAQLTATLMAVAAYPGSTTLELSGRCSLDRYALARRMPELERLGYVERGPIRQCRVGKRNATTWKAS